MTEPQEDEPVNKASGGRPTCIAWRSPQPERTSERVRAGEAGCDAGWRGQKEAHMIRGDLSSRSPEHRESRSGDHNRGGRQPAEICQRREEMSRPRLGRRRFDGQGSQESGGGEKSELT